MWTLSKMQHACLAPQARGTSQAKGPSSQFIVDPCPIYYCCWLPGVTTAHLLLHTPATRHRDSSYSYSYLLLLLLFYHHFQSSCSLACCLTRCLTQHINRRHRHHHRRHHQPPLLPPPQSPPNNCSVTAQLLPTPRSVVPCLSLTPVPQLLT